MNSRYLLLALLLLPLAYASNNFCIVLNSGNLCMNSTGISNGTSSIGFGGSGTGTVTSVTAGSGLSGGTITTSGTVAVNASTTNSTQALGWNGSVFTVVNISSSGGGSGTVTSLTEGLGVNLTPDTITTTGSIGIANLATCNSVTEYSVWNGSHWLCDNDGSGGSGTVTSVALSVTNTSAVTIQSSPITTSGTININFQNASSSLDGILRSIDFSLFLGYYNNITALQGSNTTLFNFRSGIYTNVTNLQGIYNYSLDRAALYVNLTNLQGIYNYSLDRANLYKNVTDLQQIANYSLDRATIMNNFTSLNATKALAGASAACTFGVANFTTLVNGVPIVTCAAAQSGGSAGNTNNGSGIISAHYSDVGNSGTAETTVVTYVLAGNVSVADGEGYWSIDKFNLTAGTSSKRIRAYIGATNGTQNLFYDSTAVTLSTAGFWTLETTCVRSTFSTARCGGALVTEGASSAVYSGAADILGLNYNNSITVNVTATASGVGATSNDIISKYGYFKKDGATGTGNLTGGAISGQIGIFTGTSTIRGTTFTTCSATEGSQWNGTGLNCFNSTSSGNVTPSGTPATAGQLGYNTTNGMTLQYSDLTNTSAPLPRVVKVAYQNETIINNAAGEIEYNASYTIPAYGLTLGKVYRISFRLQSVTGVAATTEMTFLEINGTKVALSPVSNTVDSVTRSATYTYHIMGLYNPSGSVGIETMAVIGSSGTSQGTVNVIPQPVSGFSTNLPLNITLGLNWSGTGSTDAFTLGGVIVEELN